MTTVAELIEYLQQLPPETDVQVAVGVDAGYSKYTTFEELKLPEGFSPSSRCHFSPNDTMEYTTLLDDEPSLWIGRI